MSEANWTRAAEMPLSGVCLEPANSRGRPVLPTPFNSDQFGMEVAPACRFGKRVDPTSVQGREVQREIVVGIERAPLAL